MDAALKALAHPGRRAMLRLVWDAELTSSEIAQQTGMTKPGASQHLKMLRNAGLVHVRIAANQRLYRVDHGRLSRAVPLPGRFLEWPPRPPEGGRGGPGQGRGRIDCDGGSVTDILMQEVTIQAPARIVYKLLTDAASFVEWMAAEARLAPRPDGQIWWRHANGDACRGQYLELVPHSRVVFTYGWERSDVGIPPGSTTVEIDLIEADGVTTLRLIHRGLSAPAADAHAVGWQHYLGRLQQHAQGTPPGLNPWADQRVPSFR